MQKILDVRNALAAALLCAGPLYSGGAEAQADSLCPYLNRVVPTAKAEFEEWKGTLDTSGGPADHTTYNAILTPGQGIKCQLFVRRSIGSEEGPPLYSCNLAEDQTYEQALALYKTAVAQLHACYPAVKFNEKTGGDPKVRSEYQEFTGKQGSASITLKFSDIGALAAAFGGVKDDKPGVFLSLDVEDTLPAAKGHAPLPKVGGD